MRHTEIEFIIDNLAQYLSRLAPQLTYKPKLYQVTKEEYEKNKQMYDLIHEGYLGTAQEYLQKFDYKVYDDLNRLIPKEKIYQEYETPDTKNEKVKRHKKNYNPFALKKCYVTIKETTHNYYMDLLLLILLQEYQKALKIYFQESTFFNPKTINIEDRVAELTFHNIEEVNNATGQLMRLGGYVAINVYSESCRIVLIFGTRVFNADTQIEHPDAVRKAEAHILYLNENQKRIIDPETQMLMIKEDKSVIRKKQENKQEKQAVEPPYYPSDAFKLEANKPPSKKGWWHFWG